MITGSRSVGPPGPTVHFLGRTIGPRAQLSRARLIVPRCCIHPRMIYHHHYCYQYYHMTSNTIIQVNVATGSILTLNAAAHLPIIARCPIITIMILMIIMIIMIIMIMWLFLLSRLYTSNCSRHQPVMIPIVIVIALFGVKLYWDIYFDQASCRDWDSNGQVDIYVMHEI